MASRYTWSISQRRALIVLIFIAAVCLGVEAFFRPAFYSDPPPAAGSHADELANRIDPNTATIAELSSIPQLGPARARDIVAYRQAFLSSHPNQRAFVRLEDLMKVKGIGRALADKLAGHLLFDAPATQPAD